jgi:hypothetical protein
MSMTDLEAENKQLRVALEAALKLVIDAPHVNHGGESGLFIQVTNNADYDKFYIAQRVARYGEDGSMYRSKNIPD